MFSPSARFFSIAAPLAGALIIALSAAPPAQADLSVCNRLAVPLSAALGYHDGQDWVSEGWWQLAPESCTKLLAGKLTARFYYLHAVDTREGRVWGGSAPLCISPTAFTIKGRSDCTGRGYARAGFHEVDTGTALDWRLDIPFSARSPGNMPEPKDR